MLDAVGDRIYSSILRTHDVESIAASMSGAQWKSCSFLHFLLLPKSGPKGRSTRRVEGWKAPVTVSIRELDCTGRLSPDSQRRCDACSKWKEQMSFYG